MAKKSSTKASLSAGSSRQIYPYILWALIAGTWLLLVLALVSYDPADLGPNVAPLNDPPANWVGRVGATLAHHAYLMVGPGIWLLLAGGLAYMIATWRDKPVTQPALRVLGVLLMAMTVSCFAAAMGQRVSHRPEGPGGLVAIFLTTELLARFNTLGTMLILLLVFWIGAILAMDEWVLTVSRWLGRGALALTQVRIPKPVLAGMLSFPKSQDGLAAGATVVAPRSLSRKKNPNELSLDDPNESASGSGGVAIADEPSDSDRLADDGMTQEGAEEDEGGVGGDAPGAYLAQKRDFDPDALRAKIKQLPINFAPKAKSELLVPREVDLSGYRFPGLDILVEPEGNFTQEMEKLVREQAVELEKALQQYRIDGEVVGIDSGPVITLFEVRLAPGTKVSALSNIASDLARALKAQNIRIVPNTAGKDTIGIEVPNLKKERVRLKELMSVSQEMAGRMGLPMYLGKDASGTPLIEDLAKMPHMLIAGTTGSGKSVCMNSIIMSFLFAKRPDELKLVLVDPKMVELSMFKDVPHLMCPVVTEMGKAAAILEWATTKMDERYELLAEAGVRDIAGYNSLSWDELKARFEPASESEEARIPKKLPYMVFVIDELADMMMTNKEVEGHIVRLAQKARAVGMHLILATQRPQANVVTGLIKGNMPCRIAFKVSSGLDSRIVLDQKGAELLLGQGDMLFLSPRSSKLTRAQGTLVDDSEIRHCVTFLKEVAQQNFEPQLVQIRSVNPDEEAGAGDMDIGERDPLFEQAVDVVMETQRGSVSLVQRRLNIGYGRASRLIEQMAVAGLLGEHKGSQAREVAITPAEWEAMKQQAKADAVGQTSSDSDSDDDDGGVPDELSGEHRY